MATKRKTKRQKLLSDKRHSSPSTPTPSEHLYHLDDSHITENHTALKSTQTKAISVSGYDYLVSDLKKISFITGIIVLLELGIYWTSVGF